MQASKAYTFRRGTTQAKINCLAFSSEGVSPRLLACASSHGTVHIWNLDRPGSLTARTSSGILASVMPSKMTEYVDPQRCVVNLRLPAGVPTICAIQARYRRCRPSAATTFMSHVYDELHLVPRNYNWPQHRSRSIIHTVCPCKSAKEMLDFTWQSSCAGKESVLGNKPDDGEGSSRILRGHHSPVCGHRGCHAVHLPRAWALWPPDPHIHHA